MAELVMVEPHGVNRGDTLYLPDPSELTSSSHTDGNAVSYQTDTSGQFSLSIDQQAVCAVRITDFAKVLSQKGAFEYYAKAISRSLHRQKDLYLHALGANFGGGSETAGTAYSKAYVGDGSSDLALWDGSANTNTGNGVAFADYILRAAMRKLEDADVTERLNFVIPPVVAQGMRGVDRYVSSDFVNGAPVVSGEMGNIYGARIASTTNSSTVLADDSTTSYRAGLLFGSEAIIYAEPKKVELWSDRDLDYVAHRLLGHQIYGAKVYRAESGIALLFPA